MTTPTQQPTTSVKTNYGTVHIVPPTADLNSAAYGEGDIVVQNTKAYIVRDGVAKKVTP